jgi:hypothetical protein
MKKTIELLSYKTKNNEKILYTDGELKYNSLCYVIDNDTIKIEKNVDLTLENGLEIKIDDNGRIYEIKSESIEIPVEDKIILDEPKPKFANIIQTNYLGYKFNVLQNDGIGIDIRNGKIWENHIREFLKRNLKSEDTFVDVGGHYGSHTILSSELCKELYSFEPQKILYDIQVKNLEDNNIKNVKVYNCGLSNKNETSKMNGINYEQSWINSGDVSVG